MERIAYNILEEKVSSKDGYKKNYNDCFIDLNQTIERPKIALSIGTYSYNDTLQYNPTFTYGEFSAIVAPSKTKKTFLKSALTACYIGGNSNSYFDNMKSFIDKDCYIAEFDTEQGKYYAKNAMKRVEKMTGAKFSNYYPFALKKLNDHERLEFIDLFIKRMAKRHKNGFVTIDGIADICENTNDIEKSKAVINYLMDWTELGVHVVCIIHKTHNNDKATGHLGSYVQKKAETVIKLSTTDEKMKNPAIEVVQQYSRGPRFESFHFNLDHNALPQKCNVSWQ